MPKAAQRPGGGSSRTGKAARRPGTAAPAAPTPGFLTRAKEDAASLVLGVPRGLMELGKMGGTELRYMVPGQASLSERKRAAEGKGFLEGMGTHAPLTSGLVQSFGHTLGRLGQGAQSLAPGGLRPSQSRFARDYGQRPVSTFVEDVANLAPGFGVAGGHLARAAKAPSIAAKPALAARLEKGAALAGKGRTTGNAIAAAPITVPLRTLGLARKPLGAVIERAARSDNTAGKLTRTLGLDAQSRAVKPLLVEGTELASEFTGRQVAHGRAQERILPDPVEQAVARLVSEGEAVPLPALRRNLDAEDFDTWVAEHLPVDPATARLAADVVEGKAPELAARIEEWAKVGREGEGGRAARTETYLQADRGREWEVGFEPSQRAIDESIQRPLGQATKAANVATRLRAKADLERVRAGDVAADASEAIGGLTGQVRGVQRAAVDLHRATNAMRRATAKGRQAVTTIHSRAELAEQRRLRQEGARAVREVRRAAVEDMRQQARDFGNVLDDVIGRPARPAARLPNGERSPMADAAAAIEAAVGSKFAAHNLWAKAGQGMPLDQFLDDWNRHHNITRGEGGGGMLDQEVIDHVANQLNTVRALRSGASGAISRGLDREAMRYINTYGDEMYEDALVGTVDEAVDRLSGGRLATGAGDEAVEQAVGWVQRGAPKGPAERSLASMFTARAAKQAAQEAATGTARELRLGIGSATRTQRAMGAAETKAALAERLAGTAERASAAAAQRVRVAAAKTAASVEAAPARLRPALTAARSAADELRAHAEATNARGDAASAARMAAAADELPTTLAAIKASGVDYDHFIHVKVGEKAGPKSATIALPNRRRSSEEKFRSGAGRVSRDLSIPAQAKAEIKLLKEAVARETIAKIQDAVGRQFPTKADADAAGFVAWDPGNLFEKASNPLPDQVYVPEHVFRRFKNYFDNPWAEDILQSTYDRGIKAFKMAVLPLSPSWQTGNIVGNIMLATFAAGVGPVRLTKALHQAIHEYRASGPKGERSFQGPRRLYTSGATHAEFQWLENLGQGTEGGRVMQAGRRVLGPGAAVVRKSYALNSFMDNLGRSAVHIVKKGEGLSDEAAVRESLKAMGDFSRMTPFERRVVKRIIPFYAWQRHMTQLAFRLPLEHPLRVAWTLHMADMLGDLPPDLEDLPRDQRGVIPWGSKLIGTRSMFPFGDAGRLLTPAGARQSVSPVIKIGAQSATGLNMFTGRPFTRAPGTARRDDFGREMPTAPSLVKQVTDVLPQKRLLGAMQGRDAIVRYDTGDPVVTKEGTVIPTGKRPGYSLARWLGVPVADRQAARAGAQRSKEAQALLDKSRASYILRRRGAGQ